MRYGLIIFALCLSCHAFAGEGPGEGEGEGKEKEKGAPPVALPSVAEQAPMTWVKRSPREDAPVSPRKGYESSWDWDPFSKRIIRHGGHNQGGGGAQYFETWTLDPLTMKWQLRLPNTSPPGVCCEKDNAFDLATRRFVRFPAFSNSHGWQWTRMIALRNWSSWAYDNEANTWRNMRPMPHVGTSPGRCAAYDRHGGAILVFDKTPRDAPSNTRFYDLYTNTWHFASPPKEPAGRSYGSMTYDSKRRRFIMFGRHYGNDPITWAFDPQTGQWLDLETENHPPSERTAPVLAYDSKNDIVLCVGRTSNDDATLQTWAFLAAENKWRKLEPEGNIGSSGHRNRLMTYIPEHDIFVMENRAKLKVDGKTRNEQQIWTFRYPEIREGAQRIPLGAPRELAVVVSEKGEAWLTWKPPEGEKPVAYRVLRGSGPVPWKAEFKPVGKDVNATEFTDTGLEKKKLYYYRVAALDEGGHAGHESLLARAQPRAMDRLAVSVLGEKQVEVSWPAHEAPDVVGYIVERADVEVYTADQLAFIANHEDKKSREGPPPVGAVKAMGEFIPVGAEPMKATVFLDRTADLTDTERRVEEPAYELRHYGMRYEEKKDLFDEEAEPYRFAVYAYRVRAVNALGVRSGPSPWFLTVPGAVENIFSKEDGDTVHLKWAASPEKNLKGYHAYRMNGRGVTRAKVSRLTAEPIAATEYSDETAGEDTQRRFFIVAVDALGQEGVPSSPVWSYREWHRYYEPFGSGLGEWHQ